ncbi:putative RecA/RadA family phage recombinase [Comamonas odontotermitis]|uniref:RecA/RadA family phage recombinase n=1 Tax=Comamonas odontotermitis TaxID=379895 RepID=A0ABR6RH37_9BURK|nr:DUF2190 family protein [Comamonas odontotermitis]MBB6578467.1 putative RecA/RadA family phage recombinase [Comamonas odontotermitis]
MKNFVQVGDVLDYTPSAPVAGGTAVAIGKRVGVVVKSLAANEQGALRVSGVATLPKVEGDALTQGDLVYLNAEGLITKTSTSNTPAGYAAYPADAGVATAQVQLNG